jgi:MFS transporter, ACS family, tartrate transporter
MATADDAVKLAGVIRKVSFRLIPFLCLLYFIAYIDRVNIGFAALTMNSDLKLSATAYGLGASMFFVGYLLFEVPSNLLLDRVGVRRWMSRIMITWGMASIAMVFVTGETSLYVTRFLLGVAEAGFFPAVIVYLNQWFPRAHRGKVTGLFFVAIPLSNIFGAPLSTGILSYMDGVSQISGWRWVFLLEGIPALLVGLFCLVYLTERPREAKWLSPDEATLLQGTLDRERAENEAIRKYSLWNGFTDVRVLALAATLLLLVAGSNGVAFWLPTILKSFHGSNMTVGWLTSGVYVLTAIGAGMWPRHADKAGNPVGHILISATFSAMGFFLCAVMLDTPAVATAGLAMAAVGVFSTIPVLWTLPASFLTGTPLAAAVALINSVAQLAAILVPWFIGWSKDTTGGFGLAVSGLGVALLGGCVTILIFALLSRSAARADGPTPRDSWTGLNSVAETPHKTLLGR